MIQSARWKERRRAWAPRSGRPRPTAAGAGLLVLCAGAFEGVLPVSSDFTLSLATDRVEYRSGEPIEMTLGVTWAGAGELVLEFPTAQRFDLSIQDEIGDELWRWSGDRMFGQALGQEVLDAARPELEFSARFDGELAPGTYRITGLLASSSHPATAGITIRVEP